MVIIFMVLVNHLIGHSMIYVSLSDLVVINITFA